MKNINIWILSILLLSACGNNGDKEEKDYSINEQEQTIAKVDTMSIRRQTFCNQLLCNGRLTSISKAELQMQKSSETLLKVLVHNGQRVTAGTLLALADTMTSKAELQKAEQDFEKASVELQDKLIGLGYNVQSGQSLQEWSKIVPDEVLRRTELTSGYHTAYYQLENARKSLQRCKLVAPFSGRIANLEGRPHQTCSKFCVLLDDSFFDVEFKILEAELSFVHLNQTVLITPFVYQDKQYKGNITEINPMVDEKGLVKVKARIRNTSDRLMDGMNVRIIVESEVKDMLVVPKEAVVERDGYHVVFMYDPRTQHAVWTYVDILYSNLTSHAITGCERKHTEVHEGDIAIISGNLNLADDTACSPN